jgi:hypothetical protein
METIIFKFNPRDITFKKHDSDEVLFCYEKGDRTSTFHFPSGIPKFILNKPTEDVPNPRQIFESLPKLPVSRVDNHGYKEVTVRFSGDKIDFVLLNAPVPMFTEHLNLPSFKDWVLGNKEEALDSIEACVWKCLE